MEHIGSYTRAYHTLVSRFVGGQPNVASRDYAREGLPERRAPAQADGLLLLGEPPKFSMREKVDREKGCLRCHLFGCAKAFDDKKECDVCGKPTVERVGMRDVRHTQ